MRTDLGMRKGKMVAQGAHGAVWAALQARDRNDARLEEWLKADYKKICLGVDSCEQLQALRQTAIESGVPEYLVVDNGLTEFGGEKTVTCLVLGPDRDEAIDSITGHLKLL